MRKIVLALLVYGMFGAVMPAWALQCVPYARQASGLSLQGDAWRWWSAAEGVYERGNAPRPGAVLVFKSTRSMRYGHVAVVSRVVGRREIRIDHANWGQGRERGQIERDVAVLDVSPRNDWTQVRVWHRASDSYGARVNPAFGFIYQPGTRVQPVIQAAAEPRHRAVPKAKPVVAAAPSAVQARPDVKPEAEAEPASVQALATPARPGADDLNRLVLARLQGDSPAPQQAAFVGERPKVALGEKRPAPKPSGRVSAPTGAKSKITADRRRS